jgi:hypothetical protein
VRGEPLLLEVFGNCVPSKKQIDDFMSAKTLDKFIIKR